MTELRLFKAYDKFNIVGRGVMYVGPCPFIWDKTEGLAAWNGNWLVSHPDANHTKLHKVKGVESFCLQTIQKGSDVAVMFEELDVTETE